MAGHDQTATGFVLAVTCLAMVSPQRWPVTISRRRSVLQGLMLMLALIPLGWPATMAGDGYPDLDLVITALRSAMMAGHDRPATAATAPRWPHNDGRDRPATVLRRWDSGAVRGSPQ